jgi:ABC-type dipeptide/oligopeptide/nickel transport system permease subunit
MRLVDMVMAIPRLVILIAIVAVFQANIFVVIVALAFTQWPFTTRMVRGEILALKEREFAEAARALGFSRKRILFRHLLPNATGPLIVVATLGVGNAIVLEAGLSFLGLGVQAGTPSWGSMVAGGRGFLMDAWWIATFPGLAIALAVLAFNLVGDGLRDALDPRQGVEGSP